MTLWEALLLGLIQGITEFLPISSSGHLALGQYFLGFENLQEYLFFNLICHLGTLTAIFLVFFSVIRESFTNQLSTVWQLIMGTLPLMPLVFILKPLKALFDQPQLLGPCFLFSSALLFAGCYWRFPLIISSSQRKWQDPLIIGCFQAAAVFPGISRSGSTISAALSLGWQKNQAVQFSFLLAIPAILGGAVLEGWHAWHTSAEALSAISPGAFLVGFCTSCVFGCFSLWLLIHLVIQDKWKYFAWYCLLIGLLTTIYFNAFGK